MSVENEEVERGVQEETGENLLVNNDREVRRRGPPKKLTYDELGVPSMVNVGYNNLVGEIEAMNNLHNNIPSVELATSHVPVRSNNYIPAVAGGNNPHCAPVYSVMSNVLSTVLCNVSTPSQFSVRLTDVPGQTMTISG